jgi:hypothetical protein
MKPDRVTILANDAITAFSALRSSIEKSDELIAGPNAYARESLVEHRAEQWEAYQRIAKALGLKPTLNTDVPA